MTKHHELGRKGEGVAVDFLRKKGYKILETNWRYRKSEIDIIVKKDEVLIFVEVKSRSDVYFGRPESFVTNRKRELMVDAANVYMEEVGHDWEIRFDIISVLFHNEKHQSVDHFQDAFFPGFDGI